jgi:hypothetical protein
MSLSQRHISYTFPSMCLYVHRAIVPSQPFRKHVIAAMDTYATIEQLKNAVFWDVTPCGSCENRRSSETSFSQKPQSHHREKIKS